MESSEDDAGTATIASRRESAREKNIGRLEEVDATSSIQQDTSEHRTSCQTPAMSEDNFDGDSVPSPSTHDVNTSTEAILDMIDEIVDGPGAPKRLPLLLDTDAETVPNSCEQQNTQVLKSVSQKPDSGFGLGSNSNIRNSEIENVESDTKCTPKTLNEDICMQTDPCDNVKTSQNDDVNINIKHQNVEIRANSKHVSSENNESLPDGKSLVSVVTETDACEKSNTELVSCVSSDFGPSSYTENDTKSMCATEQSDTTLFSEHMKSPNVRSIESPRSLENHINIDQPKPIASGNNVESSNSQLLDSARHYLDKEQANVLSNLCSISGDHKQESNSEYILNQITSPNLLLESTQTVESSSNLETSTDNKLNVVPLKEFMDYETNDKPKSPQIESSGNESGKNNNATVFEHSACSMEIEPTTASNITCNRSCENSSNNECIPPTQSKPTENTEILLNVGNITQSIETDGVVIVVNPVVSKPSLSLVVEDTIKTVVSDDQQASSSEKLLLNSPLKSIPSSSLNKTEESMPIEVSDRLKCTTSEKRDKVVVESAESTSSESSVSEVKSSSLELMTRTPLRRRLVRPALTRPDSTVSSTVDSSVSPLTSEHSSECIKDVSSSSDAVTTVQDIEKTEEMSSVSEISICKAETSTSSPKKIRLIRRKIDPEIISTPFDIQGSMRESEECESTSSCDEKSNITSEQVCVSSQIKSTMDSKTSGDNTDSNSFDTSDSPKPSSSLNNPEVTLEEVNKEYERVPSLKLHLPNENKLVENLQSHEHSLGEQSSYKIEKKEENVDETERTVPKLTIKVNNIPTDKPDLKSPIPKLTIKPLKVPIIEEGDRKPEEKLLKPSITKLNIKPILKPPEKINEIHRKSSSSEISESEYSENDDSTSTSDPASASEQGPLDVVPKVTIKLGKPGTDSEGKFYTEPNIPKLTIKGIQSSNDEGRESPSKLKLVICQSEEKQMEKVPKLTIKSVSIPESQPLSPKLTIKPLKPPEGISITSEENPPIPKLIISTDSCNSDQKDLNHMHKVTIKSITKPHTEPFCRTPKKGISENLENIPVITKLNIKPVIKPDNNLEIFNKIEEKVPVVSKINIKPIIKPNDIDFCKEDNIPKITKLNIKPIKTPDGNSSRDTDCEQVNTDETKAIVTKLNIKPILKPEDEDISKESENHSSGNSSDDNNDNIPVVTKINIKPICKPIEIEETEPCNTSKDEKTTGVVPKLIIKPLVKPEQSGSQSPKKERTSSPDLRNQNIPVVTKLNIKPIVKPDETPLKIEDCEDTSVKNPPLLMKINRKTRSDSGSDTQYHIDKGREQYNSMHHNIVSKLNVKTNSMETESVYNVHETLEQRNYAHNDHKHESQNLISVGTLDEMSPSHVRQVHQEDLKMNHKGDIESKLEENPHRLQSTNLTKELNEVSRFDIKGLQEKTDVIFNYQISNIQKPVIEDDKQLSQRQKTQPSDTNCTLLKKLLENRKHDTSSLNNDNNPNTSNCISPIQTADTHSNDVCNIREISDLCKPNVSSPPKLKIRSMQDLCKEVNESVTKPLEITISDKINQCSDQDSPRIILKINKTDHGASAKIITDEVINKNENKSVSSTESMMINRRRPILLGRKKQESESANISEGKRLRSSRIVQSPEKSPFPKKNTGKRPSNTESSTSPPSPKEAELSVLDSKRLKLGQLLSSKTLTITPVVLSKTGQISPTDALEIKQTKVNHSLLNNENCSKNGSSKLHNILSNLQAKQQIKVMPLNDIHSDRKHSESPELKSGGTSLDSNPNNIQVEIEPVNQNCDDIRETIFQESTESRDYNITPDPLSQDPLEVVTLKGSPDRSAEDVEKVQTVVEMTPQPKKRGRPRKLPVSEGAKPLVLPTSALEERPQRSLRLSRDRPVVIVKPRGRGRGRGRRMDPDQTPHQEPDVVETANKFFEEKTEDIDPTSSRIKLPRMTEALDKMPSSCGTPLTSRRRTSSSSTSDMPFYNTDTPELKVVLETSLPRMEDPFAKSPEMLGRGGRGGRGSRGRGRASPRTPRARGRGRGGGRGAMYMKETMGIYGRVCGPATTTVQLFEEETCMMDDNATPSKPSHLLDEDSQSSVKSSTNESSKAKKSKFADLFDSNKIWSASDVKEYTWPPPENTDAREHQVMMIQEQVAMFLGVKSFKRRYPELKRRAISAQERDYVLSKGIVTEALCDLGITAVDASEVLDIMLSDYPHKYEEYRSYQREKQLSDPTPEPAAKEFKEVKMDPKISDKPEPPKVDPEKTRLIMAAAAIASASEWNTRMNALRRPACVDLQSLTIQRRRAPLPSNPQIRVAPPHGFYPHALLPGQYQHTYRAYTSEQLRYFPLNTVVAAPPAPPSPQLSSSESEADWSHASSSDSEDTHRLHKRKKLTKVKRSSETEVNAGRVEEPEVDTCRTCKLRLEANRKTTHERFLVCATCNAKLHPGCVELPPDTIRKCREYAWQCAECKTCCTCARPAGDKMMFCDLCDRGHHVYCLGLQRVPDGRWHCAECAICKSCGARSPSGPPAPGSDPSPGPQGSVTEPGGPHWHHQTRRGPGGHKVYSHSLCTPCARAYRIGRYCPLCERSFIGPKGTMQLVICKLCDRQLHQDCVKQTVSSLNVLDYTCGECRRGGITSRAAAVRLAPRTIATLFMAKRRFNKYAHRQYMQKCKGQAKDDSDNDLGDTLPDDGD